MYRFIFNRIKPIIPKISQTEMIALRSGGVAIDRDIFSGEFKLNDLKKKVNLDYDKDLIDYMTPSVIKSVNKLNKNGNYDFKYHRDVMKILGKHKFLGFIIDQELGGNKKSIINQGKVLTKIASYNPALGISTMVPNSLGPGELLLHYGTEEQKDKYLEGLTCGEYIPCFGLTGPNNGSDATGNIDTGVVLEDTNGTRFIEVTIDKRYITLAPIANLVGVAFNLTDPNNLLKEGEEGVTLALLESGFPGLEQTTYHKPLNVDFPNGTLKGTLRIPLDKIIGGEKMTGNGWKMLMECLSVGRAISLPCSANGGNLAGTFGMYHYINHRNQFKIPIHKMEGVREKFMDMLINTWLINANITYTNHMLDTGKKPAVISAIMKQQATERGRAILNHGMDIYAGSGIIVGPNNFMEKFYLSAPIGITVEGSNTLTRSLMIFGQGLNNAHPHIFDLFLSFMKDDIKMFETNFKKMMGHVTRNYFKTLVSRNNDNEVKNLENNIVRFANLSNFIAVLGGKIKSKQMLSGLMADIVSNIYLSHGLIWYDSNHDSKFTPITKLCLKYLNIDTENKINMVIANYPNMLKLPLMLTRTKPRYMELEEYNRLYENLDSNNIIEHLEEMIYFEEDDIIGKMKKLSNLDIESEEYQELYQDVISVGENQINKELVVTDKW